MISDERVEELLGGRRWFAGEPQNVEVVARNALAVEPPLTQVLVRADGHTYQLIVDHEGREVDDHPDAALALLGVVTPGEVAASVRALPGEQSNTSFVFDEQKLLKLFRRVTDTPNPDVEVARSLRGVGFEFVPEVLGTWREGNRDFAMLQPFIAGATDGWALALASLRQFFGEEGVDDPAQAGGDFAPESRRLGDVTAAMHIALEKAFGAEPDDDGARMRVHGDFHLGQVLRTDEAWFVVDFEGEPARAEQERLAPTSPLKDVAGMVRSFDYAAAVAAREQDEDVADAARAWERHNRGAFLDSYWEAIGGSHLVPADRPEFTVVLERFELEKALYEVEYERAHRPTWIDIPETAVARLRQSA